VVKLLRETLYQIVRTYLRKSHTDAQNKFLRIYYVWVKECLAAFDAQNSSEI